MCREGVPAGVERRTLGAQLRRPSGCGRCRSRARPKAGRVGATHNKHHSAVERRCAPQKVEPPSQLKLNRLKLAQMVVKVLFRGGVRVILHAKVFQTVHKTTGQVIHALRLAGVKAWPLAACPTHFEPRTNVARGSHFARGLVLLTGCCLSPVLDGVLDDVPVASIGGKSWPVVSLGKHGLPAECKKHDPDPSCRG